MKLGRRRTLPHVGRLHTVSPVIALKSDCRQQNEEEVLFVGGMYEPAGGEGTYIKKKQKKTPASHAHYKKNKQTNNLISNTHFLGFN